MYTRLRKFLSIGESISNVDTLDCPEQKIIACQNTASQSLSYEPRQHET